MTLSREREIKSSMFLLLSLFFPLLNYLYIYTHETKYPGSGATEFLRFATAFINPPSVPRNKENEKYFCPVGV